MREIAKANKFDLSHEVKMDFDPGLLIPALVQDILPGDSVKLGTEIFIRMAPMLAPVLHRMDVRLYHFFVPLRIIWDDSEEFFTRGRDNDSTVTVPRIVVTDSNKGYFAGSELPDYMGIPPTNGLTINGNHYISALPFRAYQKIYNDIFIDPELQDEVPFATTSADVTASIDIGHLTQLRNRNWDKDYFCSAKLQAVMNPDINGIALIESASASSIYEDISLLYTEGGVLSVGGGISSDASGQLIVNTAGSPYTDEGRVENLMDDLGVDVDRIRIAAAMQRWVESLVRFGYRYHEYLKGTWRVTSSDARLDRAEYLGGGRTPIRISEVLNTSDTANYDQGEQSGHGLSSGSIKPIFKRFEEHGYLISLICVMPKATYYQGVEAHFKKFDHLDYANPFLADLGAQTIPKSEIYYDWEETETTNENVFGYVNRYDEYKNKLDRCAGEFRSSIDYWHLGRDFSAGGAPSLNDGFLQCTPSNRIFPVTGGNHYYAQIYHNLSVLRKLPYFSVPVID